MVLAIKHHPEGISDTLAQKTSLFIELLPGYYTTCDCKNPVAPVNTSSRH